MVDAIGGHMVAGTGNGFLTRSQRGGGPPRSLPCGCSRGRRCAAAASLWVVMQDASREAWRTGRFAGYANAREAFLRHYTSQTDAPAAVMPQWARGRTR